jgi:lipid-A-disaccharide synthase
MLVKVKFANIINIAANEEIIPELLQSQCTPENIFNVVNKLLTNKEALKTQLSRSQSIIKDFKTESSSNLACSVLLNHF